jgi:hypothetical protein
MKKESFKKELRAIGSCFKARRMLKQAEKEADRKAAGIYTKEEQRMNRERWNG